MQPVTHHANQPFDLAVQGNETEVLVPSKTRIKN
jgi:hypothetical protein